MEITGHVMKSSKLRVSSRWCPSSESLSWGSHDANFTGGFIADNIELDNGGDKPTNINGGHHLLVQ